MQIRESLSIIDLASTRVSVFGVPPASCTRLVLPNDQEPLGALGACMAVGTWREYVGLDGPQWMRLGLPSERDKTSDVTCYVSCCRIPQQKIAREEGRQFGLR